MVKLKNLLSSRIENYDNVWKEIIRMSPTTKKSIPGVFVRWGNSPRFGKQGTIIKGEIPQKFMRYLSMHFKHAKEDHHEDMIFLFSWNEWAEGGYLEPDGENGYACLEVVREALKDNY